MTETRSWDKRGRPLTDTDTGPGGVVYSYSIPSSGGYAANGDLLSYTDSVMGQWSFSYDKLDRLMTGTPSSGPYQGQCGCWGYDSFGNRTINVVSAAACTTTATATYNANNQITWLQTLGAPGYSPAGNVASDSLNQYLYDNENRVCAVRNLLTYAMTGYLYDGGGARVAKGTVANMNACPAVQGFASITAQYLLGPDGEQVTELDGSGNWQHTNLFAGGRLLATYDTNGQHFHFTDWLGTRRAQTTAAGVSEEQCQSLPFGDGLSCSGSGVDATEHHFTGKERDIESGNDYFGARYYSSTVGRFMTPDWSLKAEPVPYARLDIPQTLNLYAYVGNNPLTHTDVDGHTGEPPDLNDPACNPTSGVKCPNQVAAAKLEAKAKDDARQALQQQGKNNSRGLVATPVCEVNCAQAVILKFLSLFGITFTNVASPAMNSSVGGQSVPIPVPDNLSWILLIANGHGWEDHGQYEFDSRGDYQKAIQETVQNAKGGQIVRNPEGRKGVTGYWNDREGFVVWRDKNHPDQGTAFHPIDPDVYKTRWGFE